MASRTSKSSKKVVGAEAYPSERYVPVEQRTNGPFDDYEVRGALETLTRAIKIRRNAALMRAVRKEARKQVQAAEATSKALSGE